MSTNKHAQKDNQDTSDRPAIVPSGGRTQTVRGTIRPGSAQTHSSLAPPPPFPFHDLRLADSVRLDRGDLYMLVHRATRQLSEKIRFSLYSRRKDSETQGMRWAVKGQHPQIAANHSPMSADNVLDLRGTASLKLCFAVVLKQDVSCQTRAAPAFPTTTEKTRRVSDWDAMEQVITQEDRNLGSLSLLSSLDYVRVTVKRLESAGLLKFRDEAQFWEEILRVEEIFARGDVGPLSDRILLSRHLLY